MLFAAVADDNKKCLIPKVDFVDLITSSAPGKSNIVSMLWDDFIVQYEGQLVPMNTYPERYQFTR